MVSSLFLLADIIRETACVQCNLLLTGGFSLFGLLRRGAVVGATGTFSTRVLRFVLSRSQRVLCHRGTPAPQVPPSDPTTASLADDFNGLRRIFLTRLFSCGLFIKINMILLFGLIR